MGDNGEKLPDKTAGNGRDEKGRWTPGNHGGPGRPRRFDFMKTARDQAKANGTDLAEEIWNILSAMIDAAKDGDVKAAALVFDRLCGAVDRGPLIEIDARTGSTGPTIPLDLGKCLERLHDVAERQGLLNGDDGPSGT